MRVEVEVVAAGLVNHAMAHNGVGFLRRVIVTFPEAAAPVDDVRVTAELRDGRGGVLTRPWQHRAEAVAAGAALTIDDPPLRLDTAAMSTIDEEDAGELVVTVQVGDGEAVLSYTPVRILAARQWLLDPQTPLLSLELLAAFVQPNHPALETLLGPIVDRVLRRTGRASLAVADSTPEEVDKIVEAAFTAVHDLGIGYAEPPASWGYGQKIRGPGDVLGVRAGTCLDTTVLLAALLEHLGIGTALWIARGHAFVGYWRHGGLALPEAVSLQVAAAVNAVDLRLMGLLEPTFLTRERRPPRDLFRRAGQAPVDRYIRGGTSELVGVVDVAMARMLHVLPLPAARLRPDGVTEVVEYRPPSAAAAQQAQQAQPAPAVRPARAPRPEEPPRVRAWKNSLLDLTLRNPLLNLDRGVTQLPLLIPHAHLGAFAAHLQDGRSISVRAADDLAWAALGESARTATGLPGDVQRSMLVQRHTVFSEVGGLLHRSVMDRLRYRARTAAQETGANLLYVALGRLEWAIGDRPLSAPLLLAPVQIKGAIAPYRIAFDPAGQVLGNLSLVEKLRAEFGFDVPELRDPPQRADGDGVDVAETVRAVRQAIAAAGLPFRVDDDARLAIIAFTGYLLWRDLDEHWETLLTGPLFKHLALTPTQPFTQTGDDTGDDEQDDAQLDAVAATAPISADGSQAAAILAARRGQSFVLEGPPGTGKSQTITNILADQLASGRTVLFVAEKGAALDVVRARLEQAGLAPLTLDLHDDGARPTQVRQQLRTALALRLRPDTDAYSMSAGDVNACAATLRDYTHRLHEPGAAGLSLYAARNLQLARGAGPTLTVPPTVPGAREAVSRAVPHLSRLAAGAASAWGFARARPADPLRWHAALEAADVAVTAAADRAAPERGGTPHVAQALAEAATLDEFRAVVRLLSSAAQDGYVLGEVAGPRWGQAVEELTARTRSLREAGAGVLARFVPAALAPASGETLALVRQGVREAEASFVIGRKRRLVAAAAPLLAHLRPGAELPAKELPAFVEEVAELAGRCADVVAAWRALPGCSALPTGVNLFVDGDLDDLFGLVASLREDAARLAGLPTELAHRVEKARASEPPLPADQQGLLDDTVAALSIALAGCGSRTNDQERWSAGVGLLQRWAATAAARARDRPAGSALGRWVDAADALAALEGIAEQARWELLTGEVPAAEAVAALDRGLAAACVTERLDVQGLEGFDADRHRRTVQRFVAASDDLRGTLHTALPAAVVERRPFRSGRVFGTVAALEREVNRTRGGLSVRRLIEQYGPVIAEVTPCLLVSPDSLARFVPPGAMTFDLVVFDEASQITVPDAVGALGRAKAAVVAGDSKQLPPTAFAQLGRDEDAATTAGDERADFMIVPDEESILSEAVLAGLPRLWLTWHYRSRDEALIAFSNARYYEGRLLTFPTAPGRQLDTGMSFTRVPGTFLRSRTSGDGPLRTNPAEAGAVVAEVLRRWRAGERSLGVVTFNAQQRALIETMLVESGEPGVAESLDARREGLFVKNLENVQGDERDVILFSTGFSAAENGVLPLNFGPLNRAGGERRLNVAVTRARRRVMVFSSFEPEDLRAEETSSVGIKHLRAYLELAKYGSLRPGAADPGATTRAVGVTVDRHRDDVAARLRDRGLEVTTGLGLSEFQVDLAVSAPSDPAGAPPVLAVLLDSPAWARRRTTGDRDGLATTVLEGTMGWPAVARVWLPQWLAQPDAVLDDLVEQAERAKGLPRRHGELVLSRVSGAVPDPEAPVAPEPTGEPATLGEPLLSGSRSPMEMFVGFEPEPVGSVRRLDALAAGRAVPEVEQVIRRVVAAEGPVCLPRLGRLVVRCFGLTRLPPARLADLARAVPAELRRDGEGFVWPEHRDPVRWRGYRTFAGPLKDRPLDEVCLVELGNALTDLARGAMGIGVDDLLRETVRVFGGTRVTDPVRARLLLAVGQLVAAERLVVTAGVVRAVG